MNFDEVIRQLIKSGVKSLLFLICMLSVIRPSFEVVKEGRIFLTEKLSCKITPPRRI
jgi:hypothetical protein